MIKTFSVVFACCIYFILPLRGQHTTSVSAPNGNIVFMFRINNGQPQYAVKFKNKILVDYSIISLHFLNDSFGNNIKTGKIIVSDGVEDYGLPAGKTSKSRLINLIFNLA